jgi:hypothetical protein
MNKNNKARHLGKGAGREKQPDVKDSTINDPLIGWYSLAKESRIKRQPKRAWERRSR